MNLFNPIHILSQRNSPIHYPNTNYLWDSYNRKLIKPDNIVRPDVIDFSNKSYLSDLNISIPREWLGISGRIYLQYIPIYLNNKLKLVTSTLLPFDIIINGLLLLLNNTLSGDISKDKFNILSMIIDYVEVMVDEDRLKEWLFPYVIKDPETVSHILDRVNIGPYFKLTYADTPITRNYMLDEINRLSRRSLIDYTQILPYSYAYANYSIVDPDYIIKESIVRSYNILPQF